MRRKQAAVYSFLSSAYLQKQLSPSVLTPTLCPVSQQRKLLLLLLLLEGQSWAAVWEKVTERTDKSLWGVFDSQTISPVPGSWVASPRKLPAFPTLWTKQLQILTFHWLRLFWLNPQPRGKKSQYFYMLKSVFLVLNGNVTKCINLGSTVISVKAAVVIIGANMI